MSEADGSAFKPQGGTRELSLTLVNRRGLHARAAAKFVRELEFFRVDVAVSRDGQTVDGRSIMGLLMLGVPCGQSITLTITGPEADAAAASLTTLVEDGFGSGTDRPGARRAPAVWPGKRRNSHFSFPVAPCNTYEAFMPVSGTSLRTERGFRKIFVLNIVAGLIIAVTFGFGAYKAAIRLDSGLSEILTIGAKRWVAPISESAFIDVALRGEEPPAAHVGPVLEAFRDHGVDRVRIYGADGKVAWSARDDGTAEPLPAAALAKLQAGKWSTNIYPVPQEGAAPPLHYADLLLPIRRDGRTVGAISMRIHVTQSRAYHRSIVLAALFGFALLGLVGLVATGANAFLIARQRHDLDQIYHLAHHDALTGVPNRNRFLASLDRAMATLKSRDGGVALHIVDVDGFKAVNDLLGHDAGDKLLRIVAARLADCVGEGDVVARLGGDEFAVVQRHATRQRAIDLAERMLEAARAIRDLDSVPVSVSLSIGVALAPEHATLVPSCRSARTPRSTGPRARAAISGSSSRWAWMAS